MGALRCGSPPVAVLPRDTLQELVTRCGVVQSIPPIASTATCAEARSALAQHVQTVEMARRSGNDDRGALANMRAAMEMTETICAREVGGGPDTDSASPVPAASPISPTATCTEARSALAQHALVARTERSRAALDNLAAAMATTETICDRETRPPIDVFLPQPAPGPDTDFASPDDVQPQGRRPRARQPAAGQPAQACAAENPANRALAGRAIAPGSPVALLIGHPADGAPAGADANDAMPLQGSMKPVRVREDSMRCRVHIGSIAALLAFGSAAIAASVEDVRDCGHRTTVDRQNEACTRVIEDGAESAANRGTAHNNRGNTYLDRGDFDRALADFNAAIRLMPNDRLPYNNRGLVYYHKGDFKRAIADFSAAIKLDPTLIDAYIGRGLTHERLGRSADAIADYRRALLLDPTNRDGASGLKRLGAAAY